jgi:hypothetical protein
MVRAEILDHPIQVAVAVDPVADVVAHVISPGMVVIGVPSVWRIHVYQLDREA